MKGSLLSLMTVAAIGAASVALGQSPPNPLTPRAATGAAPDEGGTAYVETGVSGPTTGEDELEAERLAVWESPEMRRAREWVLEYGRRSRRFTTQDAENYLARLRKASPAGMRQWLQQFAARKAGLARAADVAQAARQAAVDQALARQRRTQESFGAFSEGQTQGALAARRQLAAQQLFSEQMIAVREVTRDAVLAPMYATDYSWLAFPPLYTRYAAAASLPGDLPPGDPRNFIQGDVPEPVDVGGPGATGNAGDAAASGGDAGAAGGGPAP